MARPHYEGKSRKWKRRRNKALEAHLCAIRCSIQYMKEAFKNRRSNV